MRELVSSPMNSLRFSRVVLSCGVMRKVMAFRLVVQGVWGAGWRFAHAGCGIGWRVAGGWRRHSPGWLKSGHRYAPGMILLLAWLVPCLRIRGRRSSAPSVV